MGIRSVALWPHLGQVIVESAIMQKAYCKLRVIATSAMPAKSQQATFKALNNHFNYY